ncbi:hypothetical protein [Vibrio sp.]|uniref:hypothetical protein n=1 Tax=Vibrio sp. TaxID=678 RepID=UPI00311FAAB1
METYTSQLRKEFHAQISALQEYSLPHTKPTLSFLTDEEIQLLEDMWIELSVWKKNHSH